MASYKGLFAVTISGHKELMEAFEELPKSVGDQVLRAAARKALKPVETSAKSYVPKDEGRLERSIGISTQLSKRQKRLNPKKGDVVVYVGPRYKAGAHGHLVEFGTGPRFQKATGKYVGIMPARPFMRPAWDANKDRVLETMRLEIWNKLKSTAKRLAKRAVAGKLTKSQLKFFRGF
jgi:HK97 gp10 family phage protein